jgi:hypothetical protein
MRIITQPPPTAAKVGWFIVSLFFLAMIVAITPNVLDTLARFGVIHGTKPALLIPTPQVVIRDAVPAFVPPVAPTPLPVERDAAQPVAMPASAPTPAPVAPVGIKIIVVKPADGSGPIVLRDGTKYRGKP